MTAEIPETSESPPLAPGLDERRPGVLAASRPLRVLIVDDDPELAGLLEDFLHGEGFAVRSMVDARHALERVMPTDGWRPDVILLDYMMPGMDGASLIKELQRQEVPARVVLMSASGLGQSVAEYLGVEYIAKPFDFVALVEVLAGNPVKN